MLIYLDDMNNFLLEKQLFLISCLIRVKKIRDFVVLASKPCWWEISGDELPCFSISVVYINQSINQKHFFYA